MNTQRQQFTFQRPKTTQGFQRVQNQQTNPNTTPTSPQKTNETTQINKTEQNNQNNQNEETKTQNQTNNSSTARKPLFQRQRTKTVCFGKGVMESPTNNQIQEDTKTQSNENLPIQNNTNNTNNNITINMNNNNTNNSNNNHNHFNNFNNHNNHFNNFNNHNNHFNNNINHFNQQKQSAYSTPSSRFNSNPSSTRTSSKDTTIHPIPTNSNRITFAHKPMTLNRSQSQTLSSPRSDSNSSSSSISQSQTPSQLTQITQSSRHGNVGFGSSFQNQNKPKIQPRVTIGTKTNARSSATSVHLTNTNDESGKIVSNNEIIRPIAKKTHFSSSKLSLTTPTSPGLSTWVSPSAPQPKSQQFSYIQRKENDQQQYRNPEIYLRELELKIVQLRRIAQQQQVVIDTLRQKLHYNK